MVWKQRKIRIIASALGDLPPRPESLTRQCEMSARFDDELAMNGQVVFGYPDSSSRYSIRALAEARRRRTCVSAHFLQHHDFFSRLHRCCVGTSIEDRPQTVGILHTGFSIHLRRPLFLRSGTGVSISGSSRMQ